jgi:hypothetical protein
VPIYYSQKNTGRPLSNNVGNLKNSSQIISTKETSRYSHLDTGLETSSQILKSFNFNEIKFDESLTVSVDLTKHRSMTERSGSIIYKRFSWIGNSA